ncbi:hypothetical protein SDC9_21525 [bioreactor metagenome]|uniref:KTSC domain-containing protein n=1 Tax=bioreactor metagenome TaxID=1076179 RepID=A0A644U9Q9_9ZZZZ|nr:KTSC domain-containing protein [Methanobrevibacter sp.]MEA4956648.1 KTSC domain-containing protein [Methanobrevibacter sp.]
MDRIPVNSKNLASVGYDPITQTLEIEFLNKKIYHFYGVSNSDHEDLLSADSHETYFSNNIKDKYPYKKL